MNFIIDAAIRKYGLGVHKRNTLIVNSAVEQTSSFSLLRLDKRRFPHLTGALYCTKRQNKMHPLWRKANYKKQDWERQ